jgi:hypothetical protein
LKASGIPGGVLRPGGEDSRGLLTRDRRAAATYQLLGVDYRLIV